MDIPDLETIDTSLPVRTRHPEKMCCPIKKQPKAEAPMNSEQGSPRTATTSANTDGADGGGAVVGGRDAAPTDPQKPQLRVFGCVSPLSSPLYEHPLYDLQLSFLILTNNDTSRKRQYDYFYPTVSDSVQPGEGVAQSAKRAREFNSSGEGTSAVPVFMPMGSSAAGLGMPAPMPMPVARPHRAYIPSRLRHELVCSGSSSSDSSLSEYREPAARKVAQSAGRPQGWVDDPNVAVPVQQGRAQDSAGGSGSGNVDENENGDGNGDTPVLRGGDTGNCCEEPCGCITFWCGKICSDD
ncbi:hypothetical protein F5Y04DRAFT_275593 [Hypomontagnella monticulosa]|nr:hypothetical protein F5Y04DRAFT_275593 [Hypomontagnella monticulosa]